jgi:hypothetical protein
MNEKQKAKWNITRSKGKLRFVLVDGVLKFSLSAMIAFLLLEYFVFHHRLDLQDVLVIAAICLVGGIFVAFIGWDWNESKYLISK